MPPQLLSPAAFGGGVASGTGSGTGSGSASMAMSTSFLEDRRSLRVPKNSATGSSSSSSSSSRSARPAIKRTASTASVNSQVMDMLNPQYQPGTFIDSDDDDEGGNGIGMQEDWEIEEHDPFAASTGSNRTPPGSGGSSAMMLDSPTSSPTLMTQSQQRSSHRKPPAPKMASAIMKDMDDGEDNPFLASSSNSKGPPKAPSKKQRSSNRAPDKVSYVFRGKRITYDAPLESLFPAEDEDDLSLSLHAKSGPRVLFPSPPTPSATTSSSLLLASSQNVSPPPASSSSSTANTMLLMQTPRRAPPPAAALTTPAERITAALAGERAKKGRDGRDESKAPFIPPTPASLPQKSKAEKNLERERLNGAMRGLQASHAAAAMAHRGESAEARGRRYAPYPPR